MRHIILLMLSLTCLAAAFWGWCMNIGHLLSGADMGAGEIVVRAIGVLIPIIGAVAGYL